MKQEGTKAQYTEPVASENRSKQGYAYEQIEKELESDI